MGATGALIAEVEAGGASASAPQLLEVRAAHRLPRLIVERAGELAGCPVALYVVDLDGSCLLRLAGQGIQLPDRLRAPLAVGTELPVEAIAAVRDLIARAAPSMHVVPLVVRDRALGVLLTSRAPDLPLESFASEAALALELAAGYTDEVHAARRRKPINPAAEIQQNLLPPRIASLAGYRVAGGVLPGYEIGGDFFDYADNSDGLWLAIGDAMGKGNRAAAVSSIAIGALRAARRCGATLTDAAELVHATITSLEGPQYLTAVFAICHADGTVRWISCGHPYPLQITGDKQVIELTAGQTQPLGIYPIDKHLVLGETRLGAGEQLVLYSDGVTERKRTTGKRVGHNQLIQLLGEHGPLAPSATVRAIHSMVLDASPEPLHDDATVLAVTAG